MRHLECEGIVRSPLLRMNCCRDENAARASSDGFTKVTSGKPVHLAGDLPARRETDSKTPSIAGNGLGGVVHNPNALHSNFSPETYPQ
jgi:hypothetical protein